MKKGKVILSRASASFAEYMIVLGIISAVLWGMNIYVKRGIQGKVKDLTDVFIGKGQETDISPTARTESNAESKYDLTTDTQLFTGGGLRVSGLEEVSYKVTSRIVDTDVPDTPGNLVPASEGYVAPGPEIEYDPETGEEIEEDGGD
ncbi:MAG: hypothetical protein PHT50_02495 [Candidatus Omnitrophica bacterium]|nr:hypothetical protein [Candidatus Omnitrophota bacterium]